MTEPTAPPRRVAVRILAAVVAAAAGLPWSLMVFLVVSSRFGSASKDAHGYVLIFGTLASLVLGLIVASTLPFAFANPRRLLGWCLGGYAVVSAFLMTLWFTA